MKFSKILPPDVAKVYELHHKAATAYISAAKDIYFSLPTPKCWNSAHASYFAMRPQLRLTTLQRKTLCMAKTNLSKTKCLNSNNAI